MEEFSIKFTGEITTPRRGCALVSCVIVPTFCSNISEKLAFLKIHGQRRHLRLSRFPTQSVFLPNSNGILSPSLIQNPYLLPRLPGPLRIHHNECTDVQESG